MSNVVLPRHRRILRASMTVSRSMTAVQSDRQHPVVRGSEHQRTVVARVGHSILLRGGCYPGAPLDGMTPVNVEDADGCKDDANAIDQLAPLLDGRASSISQGGMPLERL